MNCRLKHLPGLGMFITAAGGFVYEDVADQLSGWEPYVETKARESQTDDGVSK